MEERSELPAVGDFVLLKYNSGGSSMIAGLLPRWTKFSRTDFSGHAMGCHTTTHRQMFRLAGGTIGNVSKVKGIAQTDNGEKPCYVRIQTCRVVYKCEIARRKNAATGYPSKNL